MATPINPTTDPTSGPVPMPVPAASPTDAQVGALVSQFQAMIKNAQTGSLTMSQGVVAAVSLTGTPPTCSVTLSGSATQVDGVRYLEGYTPAVGDTVQILVQGGALVVLGHIVDIGTTSASSGGWITPSSLATGFTQGGNSNANLQYRLVTEAGARKMQWRGAVGDSGANSDVLVGATALPSMYRPSSKVSMVTARSVDGGMNTVGVDFFTDGTVHLVGDQPGGALYSGVTSSATGTDYLVTDVKLSGYLSQAGSDLGHGHVVDSHTHQMPGVAPSWVAFHGIEYFL